MHEKRLPSDKNQFYMKNSLKSIHDPQYVGGFCITPYFFGGGLLALEADFIDAPFGGREVAFLVGDLTF